MNLWACHARAVGHNGSRWFHVIAYTQVEAARVAALEAPSASSIRLKAVEDLDALERLWGQAVNFREWCDDAA